MGASLSCTQKAVRHEESVDHQRPVARTFRTWPVANKANAQAFHPSLLYKLKFLIAPAVKRGAGKGKRAGKLGRKQQEWPPGKGRGGRDRARHGKAGQVRAWHGMAGQRSAAHGRAWHGRARHGKTAQGRAGLQSTGISQTFLIICPWLMFLPFAALTACCKLSTRVFRASSWGDKTIAVAARTSLSFSRDSFGGFIDWARSDGGISCFLRTTNAHTVIML